jgi:hypothetical protein
VTGDSYAVGSHVEAAVAEAHHHHHPADPNKDVVRGTLSRRAVLAAFVSAFVTLLALALLALAIEGN